MKMTRRTALGAAMAATVVASAPVCALALSPERSAWNAALTNFRAVSAAYDAAIERHAAAENAAALLRPSGDKFFMRDGYNLGMGMTRERVVDRLSWTCPEADAEAVADDFMAYQERCGQASLACGEPQADAAVNALLEPYGAAREALMAVPAPDMAALIVKLEIAAHWTDDEFTAAALADARRLVPKAN